MLSPKPTRKLHPDLRIDAATHDRFVGKCKQAGISISMGVRQLVAAYLDKPFKFKAGQDAPMRDTKLPGAWDTLANVEALRKHAARAGVSHSEAIRQILHRYIEQESK